MRSEHCYSIICEMGGLRKLVCERVPPSGSAGSAEVWPSPTLIMMVRSRFSFPTSMVPHAVTQHLEAARPLDQPEIGWNAIEPRRLRRAGGNCCRGLQAGG